MKVTGRDASRGGIRDESSSRGRGRRVDVAVTRPLEPVALEADPKGLGSVRVHERDRCEAVGPAIVIHPLMLWRAATARVGAMKRVEGLPTGGVANAVLGFLLAASTAKPFRFT